MGFALRYELISLPDNSSHENIANLSSKSPAKESPTLTSSEKVTLKLGYVHSDYQKQMKRILAEFNAKYPTVEVELVSVNLTNADPQNSLDNNNLVNSLVKQGVATDLLLVEPDNLGKELFRTRYLETLGTKEEFTNFSPRALNAWSTKEGELYALPLFATSNGIYYNTEIFRQLNLEIPTTWEDLLYTAEILENYGYIPFANSTTDGKMLMDEMFLDIMPNFIGGVRGRREYLMGDRCFNDESAIAAFAAMADLRSFLATPDLTSNYYESLNLFAEGKAAMWFSSSGSVPILNSYAPKAQWSVFAVPPPAGEEEYVRFKPELGVAINANSPYQKETRQFIEWLSTQEAARIFARELPGLFPLHAMELAQSNPGAEAFIESIKTTPLPDSDWGLQILRDGLPDGYSLMRQGVVGVVGGKLTPTEAADNLQRGLAKWFQPAQTCGK